MRVEGWPPDVPMRSARPFDDRNLCTFEFLPLAGDDLLIGVVASYFREPTQFRMVATLPDGRTLTSVTELRSGRQVDVKFSATEAAIRVEMKPEDALKVFVFELR